MGGFWVCTPQLRRRIEVKVNLWATVTFDRFTCTSFDAVSTGGGAAMMHAVSTLSSFICCVPLLTGCSMLAGKTASASWCAAQSLFPGSSVVSAEAPLATERCVDWWLANRLLMISWCRRFSNAPLGLLGGLECANTDGTAPGFKRRVIRAVRGSWSTMLGSWVKSSLLKCAEHSRLVLDGHQFARLVARTQSLFSFSHLGNEWKLVPGVAYVFEHLNATHVAGIARTIDTQENARSTLAGITPNKQRGKYGDVI